jgi:hypothetical protein
MKRWNTLALLLASGSLAACGSESTPPATDAGMSTDMGSPTDTGTPGDTGTATDAPRTDTGTPDAGGLRCGSLSVENLNTVGTRMGNVTRVMGDSTAAYMAQTMGNPPTGRTPVQPPSNNATCIRMSGQVAYSYTTGAMPAGAAHLTTNPGTRATSTRCSGSPPLPTTLSARPATTTTPSSPPAPTGACRPRSPPRSPRGHHRVRPRRRILSPGTGGVTTDRGPSSSASRSCPRRHGRRLPRRRPHAALRPSGASTCVGSDPGSEMGTCRCAGLRRRLALPHGRLGL